MCSLDVRSKGQFACLPGKGVDYESVWVEKDQHDFAMGRLILSPVDPEHEHFR